jgi:large subunit ribosomal protein L29
MKNSELRGLSIDELANKLAIEKEAYSKLTFSHAH